MLAGWMKPDQGSGLLLCLSVGQLTNSLGAGKALVVDEPMGGELVGSFAY